MHRSSTHWTRLLHVDLLEFAPTPSSERADAGLSRDHGDGEAIESAGRAILTVLRQAWSAHERRREAHKMRAELRMLDDRVLRDLGMDCGEIDSIVAELTGEATPTRRRTSIAMKATPVLHAR